MDMGEDINIKKCFCRDMEDESTCPPKGMIDVSNKLYIICLFLKKYSTVKI